MHEMADHGCSKRNIDGTNRLIKKGDICSRPAKCSISDEYTRCY